MWSSGTVDDGRVGRDEPLLYFAGRMNGRRKRRALTAEEVEKFLPVRFVEPLRRGEGRYIGC